MCLAIEGKINSIQDNMAEVDFGSLLRKICLDLTPEAKIGDYVLAHAGFAIQILDETYVQELRQIHKEMDEKRLK